jgi:hypothetical protein
VQVFSTAPHLLQAEASAEKGHSYIIQAVEYHRNEKKLFISLKERNVTSYGGKQFFVDPEAEYEAADHVDSDPSSVAEKHQLFCVFRSVKSTTERTSNVRIVP